MSSAKSNDPMAGIATVINQISQQKKLAEEENRRIQKLVEIQDTLIEKQRQTLQEISNTSQELKEIEAKRSALKEQLSSQKTKLLCAASESSDLTSLIEQTVTFDDLAVSNGASGQAALKCIEEIQKAVFSLTNSCLEDDNLSIPGEQMNEVILTVNDIIQTAIQSGTVKESTEDTVRRQSFVISSLVPPQPTESE